MRRAERLGGIPGHRRTPSTPTSPNPLPPQAGGGGSRKRIAAHFFASTSSSLTEPLPRRKGRGWVSCGAQPVR